MARKRRSSTLTPAQDLATITGLKWRPEAFTLTVDVPDPDTGKNYPKVIDGTYNRVWFTEISQAEKYFGNKEVLLEALTNTANTKAAADAKSGARSDALHFSRAIQSHITALVNAYQARTGKVPNEALMAAWKEQVTDAVQELEALADENTYEEVDGNTEEEPAVVAQPAAPAPRLRQRAAVGRR